jgi:hypothetical protein
LWITRIAIAAVAIYLILIAVGIIHSHHRRSYDSQMMAGCLWITGAGVLVVGALLAVSIIWQINWLRNIIAPMVIGPMLLFIPGLAVEGVKRLKKDHANREWPVPAPELPARLSGQTHVIQHWSGDGPLPWYELRYYSPDGKLRGYKRVEGKITALPAEVTWRVEGNVLITLSSLEPDKPNRYKLTRNRGGGIVYYLADTAWKALAFSTVEIRQGEPVVSE